MADVIAVEVRLDARRADVFAAFTDAGQLQQWLAEHAEVDFPGNRFDFWGRFTPGRDRDAKRLLDFERDERLVFGWNLRGHDTTVRIEFEADEDAEATLVRVTHDGVPERADGEGHLGDFWMLALENLRAWVSGGDTAPKPDFATATPHQARVAVEIAAGADAVFAALIEPALLNRWIATDAAVEPAVGGRYDFGWGSMGPVTVLEFEKAVRLAYSWRNPGEVDTVVTWELTADGGRTRLTLVHSGFGDKAVREEYLLGWQMYLNRIKFLVEHGGAWTPAQEIKFARS